MSIHVHHRRDRLSIYPQTQTGWWALWLMLPVVTYPLYWEALPFDGPGRWLAVAVAASMPVVTTVSLAVDATAIMYYRERSLLSIGLGAYLAGVIVAVGVAEILLR